MLEHATKNELTELITSELERLIPNAEIDGKMTKADFLVLTDDLAESDVLNDVDDLDDVTEILEEENVQMFDTSHIAKILTHTILNKLA
ncbi:hypothetical protein D1157_21315 [Anaerotruncus sp. X29]|nr:hypothetical protein [Anaerotruncus sp. X29]